HPRRSDRQPRRRGQVGRPRGDRSVRTEPGRRGGTRPSCRIASVTLAKTLPYAGDLRGKVVDLSPLTWDVVPALLDIARSAPDEFALTTTPRIAEEAQAYFGEALADVAAGVSY